MPVLTPSQALLIGFIVAPSLFVLCAYFTKATSRHVLGAVLGVGVYALVEYVWDRAAAIYGWWTYPAWTANGRFPLTGYLLAGIVGGGAMGLIGWRIIRRWHGKGLAAFLGFWVLYAIVHDYGGSRLFASSNLMAFGPGPVPILANMLWYITGNALPQIPIWMIGETHFMKRGEAINR